MPMNAEQQEHFEDMRRRLSGRQNLDFALVLGLKHDMEQAESRLSAQDERIRALVEKYDSLQRLKDATYKDFLLRGERIAALEGALRERDRAWADMRQCASDGDEAVECCAEHYDRMDKTHSAARPEPRTP